MLQRYTGLSIHVAIAGCLLHAVCCSNPTLIWPSLLVREIAYDMPSYNITEVCYWPSACRTGRMGFRTPSPGPPSSNGQPVPHNFKLPKLSFLVAMPMCYGRCRRSKRRMLYLFLGTFAPFILKLLG
ncbi:hypothetical protein BJ170DRAFT_607971 [Xylariales sp. AK1849]|nr:hypothetical protein BJ170DRAFT_607971 [Xylariales sp. AK1849]